MLPTQILQASQIGRLMVLAGAGISKDAPSHLPDWSGFNLFIREEIVRVAGEIVRNRGATFTTLLRAEFPVAAFSDAIVNYFAGDSYFPVLRVLDSNRPNRNHAALAELARLGGLAAIFTTNFDTLIEQSFRAAGVELRLFVERTDFTGTRIAPPCGLFKLHGSVKQTTTLIDTVSQKLRGLPPYVRNALSGLDPGFPLLVIGFSGTDLEFDRDYLPLLGNGRFVTWVVNPDREPAVPVLEKLSAIGGVIVKARLPEVFAELGILQPDSPPIDPHDDVDARVRALIGEWLDLPHIGPWTCAAFCAELLNEIGDTAASRAVASELDTLLRDATETPITAGKVYRVLSLLATREHDPSAALLWAKRELQYYDAIQGVLNVAGHAPSAEARREHLTNEASAMVNIAVALRANGDLDDAEIVLSQALPRAVEVASPYVLSLIELNLTAIATLRGGAPDDILDHARNAATHAHAAAHVQAILESHLAAGKLLMEIGEYAAAKQELDAATDVLGISMHAGWVIEVRRSRAELVARRGNDADAMSELDRAWKYCGADGRRRLAVVATATKALAHSIDGREWLRVHVDQLDAAGDQLQDVITGFRQILAEPPPQRPFFIEMAENIRRRDVRLSLVISEYRGDAAQRARCLAELMREPPMFSRPRRLVDLASALLEAAREADDWEFEQEAWNGLGIAHDKLGNLNESANAFRHELALAPTGLDRARSTMNLALVVSRMGSVAETEALFIDARAALEQGPPEDRGTLFLNWARHRLRHRMAGALEFARCARAAADEVENPSAIATCDSLIAEILAMNAPSASFLPTDASAPDLANAGLRQLGTGNVGGARTLIEKARAMYEHDGDELGASRCLNNLADCSEHEGNVAEAIELATKALAIRIRYGDLDGEALTRASLAWRFIKQQEPERAFEHAERALLLLHGKPVSRVTAMASSAQAVAHALLGRSIEAREVARIAVSFIRACEDASVRQLLHLVEPLLEPFDPVPPSPPRQVGEVVPPIDRMMMEAERLHRIGDFDGALLLLQSAKTSPDATPQHHARIAGDRANVLQSSGRDADAAQAYESAAALLHASGEMGLAQQAVCQGAVSLRRAGELAKSEERLRALLAQSPPEPIATEARLALAKTIAAPYFDGASPEDGDPRFAEAKQLVNAALASKLDDATYAHALLASAQFLVLADSLPEAETQFRKSHAVFLRFNSPHAALVEAQLEQLVQSKFGSRPGILPPCDDP